MTWKVWNSGGVILFWNGFKYLKLNNFKVIIMRTEIPVVWNDLKDCEINKYYDWKYLWILVRNDLNTSGMKYLYVIDLVGSITKNYGVFGIGDISLIWL